jgi:MORN repeat
LWSNGKADGAGEMIFTNGNCIKGVWRDGKLMGNATIEFGKESKNDYI